MNLPIGLRTTFLSALLALAVAPASTALAQSQADEGDEPSSSDDEPFDPDAPAPDPDASDPEATEPGEPAPVPPPAPTTPATFPAMGKAGTQLLLGPDTWLRFGFLERAWVTYEGNANPGTEDNYSLDFFMRQTRFIVVAQFFKDVNIFILFDSQFLGKSTQIGAGTDAVVSKQFAPQIVQDAVAEIKLIGDALILDGGLMLVPFSHNNLQTSSGYIPLDISNTVSVFAGAATSDGRDAGFQLKGYTLADKLEWRLFVGQGLRQPAHDDKPIAHNAPRLAGHLQYQFLEPDNKFYVYQGTTFGKKKLFGISAGFDYQKAEAVAGVDFDPYYAVSAGFFGAIPLSGSSDPVNGGDEVAFGAEFYRYDGGGDNGTFPGIREQNDFNVEALYYNKAAKLGVFGKFEMQRFAEEANQAANTFWAGGGLKYFIHNGNASFTLQYQRTLFPDAPEGAPSGFNQLALQMQVFYL